MVGTAPRAFAHPTIADLLRAQARFHAAAATNQHDGQITKNLSSPFSKNIPLNFQSKSSA
jgi:hypothetical protein